MMASVSTTSGPGNGVNELGFGMFARQPVAGTVKTRLARDLGNAAAAELYAGFLADLLQRFEDLPAQRCVAYTAGEGTREWFQAAAPGWHLWEQPSTAEQGGEVLHLGDRMTAFFRHLFARGVERVVLIGSDSPTLPREHVAQAFELLRERQVVLGPATDGGYVMIGLQRQAGDPAELFSRIDWSTARVLEQTVAATRAAGRSLGLLPPWYDVDTIDDLQFLQGHLAALAAAGQGGACPKTSSWLAAHT